MKTHPYITYDIEVIDSSTEHNPLFCIAQSTVEWISPDSLKVSDIKYLNWENRQLEGGIKTKYHYWDDLATAEFYMQIFKRMTDPKGIIYDND